MNTDEAWERLTNAQVARMATITTEGSVDVVPIVFAILDPEPHHRFDQGILVTAVDHKPKTTMSLKRLENIRSHPEVTAVVDHYEDDWDQLWWIRVRGQGRVLADSGERQLALDALVAKYAQYREKRPQGDVIAVDIIGIQSWTGAQ